MSGEKAAVRAKAPRKEIVHYHWGNTRQIMKVLMIVCNRDVGYQVEHYAKEFEGGTDKDQYQNLKALWQDVRAKIPYVPDPHGTQRIKHPVRTWEDATKGKGADCKSMTVFIRFVLYNLGIPHKIRFTSYVESGRIQHVYPVAILGGKEVILDAVYEYFDEEVPYTHKEDRKPKQMTRIVEIAGLFSGLTLPARPWFPISRMTDGELQLAITAREMELVSAINRQMGFGQEADEQERVSDHLKNILAKGVHQHSNTRYTKTRYRKVNDLIYHSKEKDHPAISGPFSATNQQIDFCKDISDQAAQDYYQNHSHLPAFALGAGASAAYSQAYTECISEKEMENVINAHLIDAGPNLLYDQMGPDQAHNTIITAKTLNQRAWVYKSHLVTGLSEGNIRGIARTGTIELLGATPEALKSELREVMTKEPGVHGLPAIIGIITAIISVVGAGVELIRSFQRQVDPLEQAFRNIPDPGAPNFLIEQGDFAMPVDGNSGSTNGSNSGAAVHTGAMGPLEIGAGLVGAYLLLSE